MLSVNGDRSSLASANGSTATLAFPTAPAASSFVFSVGGEGVRTDNDEHVLGCVYMSRVEM